MSEINTSQQEFVQFLQQKGRASATILAYGNDIVQFVHFLERSKQRQFLIEITSQDIEAFKKDLLAQRYTTKSVARKLNSIKTYFRYLKSEKNLQENPSDSIQHPKYSLTPPRILTKMEYRSLRDVCRNDARMYAIVELFLQTGIRISELARLSLEDVKNNKINILAHESHNSRSIPLNKSAKNALGLWLKTRPNSPHRNVFITKTGNPFQVRNIRTALNRQFRLADIKDATVNDLRHTFIAHQLKAGTPLVLVSKLSGHKRLSTTEKYLEFIKEEKGNPENPNLQEL